MNRLDRLAVVGVVAVVISIGSMSGARAQDKRIGKGDLAEFVTGLGPMLGEVIDGPDASNYYVLEVPGKGPKPVNGKYLRLVQRAGTPNAPYAAGDTASWVDMDTRQTGKIEKVNGAWCQVKSADATSLGWVACKDLRTAKQAAKPSAANAPNGTGAAASAADASPTAQSKGAVGNMSGEWESADGTFKFEFQPKGKCYFSAGPMSTECTYQQKGKQTMVLIEDEDTPLVLTANDDGSLSSPKDSMIPMRLKRKKQ